jgi:single-strand DNA-binding protein
MNKTIITGNVGKVPEMRYTPNGQAVTSFSVAVNRKWADDHGEHKETQWFRIATWGKLAEVCNQYVTKGMKVMVEGRLTCDPTTGGPKVWTRQDGTAGASFELTAASVEFLSGSKDDEAPTSGGNFPQEIPPEEDIPF